MKYILLISLCLSTLSIFGQEDNIGLLDGKKRKAERGKTDTISVRNKSSNNYIADGYISGVPIMANHIYFSEIDSVNATKDELFIRAKAFLTKVFPNFSNVVKVDDKDLGKISVRGLYRTNLYSFLVNTTISVKDNKYKYEFADFTDYPDGHGMERYMNSEKRANRFSAEVVPYMEGIISMLKKEMRSKSDNW